MPLFPLHARPALPRRLAAAGLLAACLLALLATAPPAAAQDDDASRQERLRRYQQRFPDADTNADGTLTPAEAQAHMEARRGRQQQREAGQPAPAHADIRYGDHSRQSFDLWLPADTAAKPCPVLVFFHGGGFVQGNKSLSPLQAQALRHGVAAVSANYRFVDGETTFFPTPFLDGARVIQTLRARAADWGLDPARIVLSGGSAGGNMSVWIALHDDLADPDSPDPVARQSTRVLGVIGQGTQTSNDPRFILANISGNPDVHPTFAKAYPGVASVPAAMAAPGPELLAALYEYSAINHVSPDDPPLLLTYGQAPPAGLYPADTPIADSIHSAKFGQLLQAAMAKHGLTCHVTWQGHTEGPQPDAFLRQLITAPTTTTAGE